MEADEVLPRGVGSVLALNELIGLLRSVSVDYSRAVSASSTSDSAMRLQALISHHGAKVQHVDGDLKRLSSSLRQGYTAFTHHVRCSRAPVQVCHSCFLSHACCNLKASRHCFFCFDLTLNHGAGLR